ncbi:DUF6941 family protein [Gluconobacter japonicus]|uniref:DUF6941 family protein n=1 Tax=Gluconobacter japonicus TaxID=376620 RepID=UPI001B8B38E1|nr:hypothetical protein [Gluconobacter japonicus]MBS1050494.1 hypothetical protein [Gluconobacter japonicus]
MPNPEFKVIDAILCDDIRAEIGGKSTIIGATAGSVIVSTFPAKIKATFWIKCRAKNMTPGNYKLDFRLREKNSNRIFYGVQININAKEEKTDEYIPITPPVSIFLLEKPAVGVVEASFDGGEFDLIQEIGFVAKLKT